MNIEPITALGVDFLNPSLLSGAAGQASAPAESNMFAGLLDQLSSLNTRMQANDTALQSVALGDSGELHRVLMNLESTRLSFDLMLQVRGKILDAYQEVMRLQV